MAFFPDVNRGDIFKPNALLSNNIRHFLNALNGFDAKSVAATGGMLRIQVYNCSKNLIKEGTAVNFPEENDMCENAVPAVPMTDPNKVWGVLINPLEPDQIGSCIICGPVKVKITGTGTYAIPTVDDPSVFIRGTVGYPLIFTSGKEGLLLHGASTQDVYNGPFALSYDPEKELITVAPGYINRNGDWKETKEYMLKPENGFLCIHTKLDENGVWTEPEIQITTPGLYTYPIGQCIVEEESVAVSSFRVPVAIFMVTEVCKDESEK